MSGTEIVGLSVVMLAGIFSGGFAAPIKVMKRFGYPHWALLSQLTALIILPWTAILFLCPDAFGAYTTIPVMTLVKANLFSFAWGLANVLCGLCLVRIGFSLTIGLLSGIGLPIGVLLPLFFKGSGKFSEAPSLASTSGQCIMMGVLVLLVAVVVMARAGFGRDRAMAGQGCTGKGFTMGFAMAVLAGMLQVGLSFAFVYTQAPISAALEVRGASPVAANMGVWAVTLLGGALPNLAYPVWLLVRERSWGIFAEAPREILLSLLIGLIFFMALLFMGTGMKQMGALGASVGFGVYQAMQLAASQAVGIFSGEWRGIVGKPWFQMVASVGLILVAVAIFAVANVLQHGG